jgi:acetoin utilization protein AcuB
MRIRDVMTPDPITVHSDTLVLDARRIMKEKKIRRLPVVDRAKLVGIITEQDINEAVPPPTTSINVFDLQYALSRMKVKEIMKENPATLSADTPFEDALKIGQEKKISTFLVVEKGILVGITTESDIVKVLTHVLGLNEEGMRMTIEGLGGKLGDLQKIISILDQHGAVILSMMTFFREKKRDWMLVLRTRAQKPEPIVDAIKQAGYQVTYVR